MSVWLTRPVKPGGVLNRHPLSIPVICLSIAWVPYVIIFARSYIEFGDLGGPAYFPSLLYWALLAFQLFVCVISHSLALRTMIGTSAPRWLFFASLAFFCLSPMWGMLTATDVRHPLFAMMICVLTSATAYIVYKPHPKSWLWIELGIAGIMVCILRPTGFWSVVCVLIFLLAYQTWRQSTQGSSPNNVLEEERLHELTGHTSDIVSVVIVSCGFLIFALLLQGVPSLDHAAYSGPLVGQDLALAQIEASSLNIPLATSVADALLTFQELPVIDITFAYMFYVIVFAVFVGIALIRRNWRSLIVAMPQIAIFAVSFADPSYATLSFIIPAIAAQVMFFGVACRPKKPSRT